MNLTWKHRRGSADPCELEDSIMLSSSISGQHPTGMPKVKLGRPMPLNWGELLRGHQYLNFLFCKIRESGEFWVSLQTRSYLVCEGGPDQKSIFLLLGR